MQFRQFYERDNKSSIIYQNRQFTPQSAFKNRHQKRFLTEIPQGQQYFTSSRKKQYVKIHNRSEIKQISLFDQGQKLPLIHNNLSVKDIQGASPGTLISTSIKNKLKSKMLLNCYQHLKKKEQGQQKLKRQNGNYMINPQIQNQQRYKNNYHIENKFRSLTSPTNIEQKRGKLRYNFDIIDQKIITQTSIKNEIINKKQKNKLQIISYPDCKQDILKEQSIKKLILKPNFQYIPPSQLRKWNPTFLPQNINLMKRYYELPKLKDDIFKK